MKLKLLVIGLMCAAAALGQSPGIADVTYASACGSQPCGTTPTLTALAGITHFAFTLTANITSSTFSSVAAGNGSLKVCENGTGGYTFAFPANFVGFTQRSTVANYCQTWTWHYDGTNVTAVADSLTTAGGASANCLHEDGSVSVCGPQTINSGSALALPTGALASGACASTVQSAVGTAATDVISWSPSADWSGITGYSGTSGVLTVYPFATLNTVTFKVCNWSGSSVTPSAASVNWRVTR